MRRKHHCPNCGAPIVLASDTVQLECPQCHNELVLESGSKLYLAKPSRAYLDVDGMPRASNQFLQDSHFEHRELSESRQKRTTVLAQERIAQERRRRREGMISGFLGITIGLLVLGLLGIQIYYSGANTFNNAGVCLAILFVIVEVGVVLWFRKAFPLDK